MSLLFLYYLLSAIIIVKSASQNDTSSNRRGENKMQVFQVKGVPIGVFTGDTGDLSLETERSSQGKKLNGKDVKKVGKNEDFPRKSETGSSSKKLRESGKNIAPTLEFVQSPFSRGSNQRTPLYENNNQAGPIQKYAHQAMSNQRETYRQGDKSRTDNYQLVNYPEQGNMQSQIQGSYDKENLPRGSDHGGYGLVWGGNGQSGKSPTVSYQLVQHPGRSDQIVQGFGNQGGNDQRGSYSSIIPEGAKSPRFTSDDYQVVRLSGKGNQGGQGVGIANQNFLQNNDQRGSYIPEYWPEGGSKGVNYQFVRLPGNYDQGGQLQGLGHQTDNANEIYSGEIGQSLPKEGYKLMRRPKKYDKDLANYQEKIPGGNAQGGSYSLRPNQVLSGGNYQGDIFQSMANQGGNYQNEFPLHMYPSGNAPWSKPMKEESLPWDRNPGESFPGIVNLGGGVVDGIYEGGVYPWAGNHQNRAPWGVFQSELKKNHRRAMKDQNANGKKPRKQIRSRIGQFIKPSHRRFNKIFRHGSRNSNKRKARSRRFQSLNNLQWDYSNNKKTGDNFEWYVY